MTVTPAIPDTALARPIAVLGTVGAGKTYAAKGRADAYVAAEIFWGSPD